MPHLNGLGDLHDFASTYHLDLGPFAHDAPATKVGATQVFGHLSAYCALLGGQGQVVGEFTNLRGLRLEYCRFCVPGLEDGRNAWPLVLATVNRMRLAGWTTEELVSNDGIGAADMIALYYWCGVLHDAHRSTFRSQAYGMVDTTYEDDAPRLAATVRQLAVARDLIAPRVRDHHERAVCSQKVQRDQDPPDAGRPTSKPTWIYLPRCFGAAPETTRALIFESPVAAAASGGLLLAVPADLEGRFHEAGLRSLYGNPNASPEELHEALQVYDPNSGLRFEHVLDAVMSA